MDGGGAVTMQLAPWHWRDKFDARNPEEANRQQLLKVHWLFYFVAELLFLLSTLRAQAVLLSYYCSSSFCYQSS